MEEYVDAVVIPVPDGGLDAYRELAEAVGEVWMDHGACSYFEGVAVDEGEASPPGRTIDDVAGVGPDEATVVSFIGFESRAHRNEVTAAVLDDPAYRELLDGGPPFDPARMATASLWSLVSYRE